MVEALNMPAQSSVVLLRMQDYARRPVAEQARLRAQLDTLLALLLPDIAEASRIVLGGHGSAAVAFLDSPVAALSFAERALFAKQAGLNLSIGIDHGPVEVIKNSTGEKSTEDHALAGDGIATASVMAAAASEAGLLVSQNFRNALAQALPGAEFSLVQTHNFSDANLRTYQVFGLDRKAPGKRRKLFLIIAASTLLLLLASAFAVRYSFEERPRPLAQYFNLQATDTIVIERIIRNPHGKR
jgi:hypothetical protein